MRWTAPHPGVILGRGVLPGHVVLVKAGEHRQLRGRPWVKLLPKYDEQGRPILYNY